MTWRKSYRGSSKPDPLFAFPAHEEHGSKHKFSHEWLNNCNWLAYSNYLDGGFCLPCVVFSKPNRGCDDFGVLVTRPMKSLYKATELLRKHNNAKYYKNALADMVTFKHQMDHRSSVVTIANDAHSRQVQKNRLKLLSIAKCILFCGRQKIPLRGHRDDAKWFDVTDHNPGNFQSLLDFQIDSGDDILKEHFTTFPRNATYRSKVIQNQLIEIIGEQLFEKILVEARKAPFFSILGDEVADVSNEEQLSLVI